MNILSAEKLTKSYGEKILFDQVTLGIQEGDKIGLIGVNGTGKSTLLRVLAGREVPDGGQVTVGGSIRIEYLPQEPEMDPELTVLQQVFRGGNPVMRLVLEYEETMERLHRTTGDGEPAKLQERLIRLSQQMDELQAWTLENEAKTILGKLGIRDVTAKIGTLSGGQKKRAAMASALLQPADLLILDEPTNHIDNETVAWLEQYLQKRRGALLMITHDRYFLDRVVNKTWELHQGKLHAYTANYSRFLELKAEREERELASEDKRQNTLRRELEWIRRGAQARSTKQKARIERFQALMADKPEASSGKIDMAIGGSRLGKQVIDLEGVGKGFGARSLFRGFSHIVQREDRIGIIGPNGSGKSTLLKIIAGIEQPDEGKVITGSTVKIGYYSQEREDMRDDQRVIEYIKDQAEVIETLDGHRITASQMLERFLFPPKQQWTPISRLSGGEKRRLYLLRILMSAPNILLLDEPTNDLDVDTLAILEEYIDDFPGAVIVVSHDRYFLDRVAEKIVAFDGRGSIETHVGNYSEYREFLDKKQEVEKADSHPAPAAQKTVNADADDSPKKPLKFTYKEQKEFEYIDDRIAEAEEEIRAISEELERSGSDSAAVQRLAAALSDAEKKLDGLLERWTYLNELAEQIANQKK